MNDTKSVKTLLEIIEWLINKTSADRRRRYATLQLLHEAVEEIRRGYEIVFKEFEDAMPKIEGESFETALGERIDESRAVEMINNGKELFLKRRHEVLAVDRGLWKDKVAAWLQAANNEPEEQKYLLSVFWFLKYRDTLAGRLPDAAAIPDIVSDVIARGGNRAFDSPSERFTNLLRSSNDPVQVYEDTKRMREHVSNMYVRVEREFRSLQSAWKNIL